MLSLKKPNTAAVMMPTVTGRIHADRAPPIDPLMRRRISLLDMADTGAATTEAAATVAAAATMRMVMGRIHADRMHPMHPLMRRRITLPDGPADTDTDAAGFTTHKVTGPEPNYVALESFSALSRYSAVETLR
jgi:hypothetical protein